jgi:hypothetical protein
MALIDQLFISGVWVDANSRLTNTSGTPVVSALFNGQGRALSDEYSLTFNTVVAGTGANVVVQSLSPNNPYRATKAILLDNATVYKDVIPGISLVFSNNGGFTNGWTASVKVGEFLGTFDAFGGDAGTPSDGVRHRIHNTGTGAVSAAKARILPIAKFVKKTGNVFDSIKFFAEGATEKTAGGGSARVMPYVMTITGTAGAGAGKTCTVQVDGVTFPASSLRNLSTGIDQDGTSVKCLATTFYRVVLGNLTGLEFAIAPAAANGDTANLLIFSPRFCQIAPDVAGEEGAYDTADVNLTQSGEATGVIQPDNYAYYWRRVTVPNGGNAESNPYPIDVALSATETGAAGWSV